MINATSPSARIALKSRAFDITRARTEIGYAPKVTLREGIARTLEWYRQHKWL